MQGSKSKKEPSKSCPAKKLTLEEAIAHAEKCADDTLCGQNHKQLAEWLKELRVLKSAPVGNSAAMREALEAFVESVEWLCEGDKRGMLKRQFGPLLSDARVALAAPARQCDVGSAEEQSDRYEAHCDAYHKATGTCDDCPIYKEECKMTGSTPHCQLVWAQMPYEEGGAK